LENPLDIDLTFDPYPYIYLVAGASIARIAKFSNGSELTCGTGCYVVSAARLAVSRCCCLPLNGLSCPCAVQADVPDVGTTIEIVCAPNAGVFNLHGRQLSLNARVTCTCITNSLLHI
jgi:hypothetical protein